MKSGDTYSFFSFLHADHKHRVSIPYICKLHVSSTMTLITKSYIQVCKSCINCKYKRYAMYKVIRYQCIGKNPTVVTDQIEIDFSMLICLGHASTSHKESVESWGSLHWKYYKLNTCIHRLVYSDTFVSDNFLVVCCHVIYFQSLYI